MLDGLVVPDGVSLVEDDAVPPEAHHAVPTLALTAGAGSSGGGPAVPLEGLLAPAGGEVAGQGVVGGDHLPK